ncbi:MAG: hypothetical protein ABSG53_20295, partial [Thermoguttaceae bacterium]
MKTAIYQGIVSAFCLAAQAAVAADAGESKTSSGTLPAAGKMPTLPVIVTENDSYFTLANANVTARVNKRSGDLVSLQYRGRELLGKASGHACGYWSHTTSGAARVVDAVTIDPHSNGGQRGEVSIKSISQGTAIGSGPGGSTVCDIEIRYSLGRGDSGLYTYSIFNHEPDYPATSIGEARFAAKLNEQV